MMAMVGMFSAIATVLYLFDFPLPFLAPEFYKVDFSELPVLIGSFAFGPVAGGMIEFCKILLKMVMIEITPAFSRFKGATARHTKVVRLLIAGFTALPMPMILSARAPDESAFLSCFFERIQYNKRSTKIGQERNRI